MLAEADPELAKVRQETEDERHTGIGAFIAHLDEQGALATALPRELVVDSCWALTSPQLYSRFRHARGWSREQYRLWLATMLDATLRSPDQSIRS